VQIDRNAGDGWEQALNNMPVIGGARIYAAENSKAELELEDGSSVRLVGPAQITVSELSSAKDGAPVNVIQVDSGMVYVSALLHRNDDFSITASTGESFTITQPSHLRFKVDQQVASLSVIDGEVSLQNGSANSTIRGGETYNNILGQPESAARQETVPPQPEDAWDQQRNTYNDQYASTAVQPTAGDNSDSSGVADLGYYGTYDNLPGYGLAWQPNGVGTDWDPFGYGAWSYYPGWGWTFVSGYPWGWAPFYYGDWCYIGGRGWWWRPGQGGHGPHLPGSPGWHPQPRWTGHPANNWAGPHAPAARVDHGTVAVAGSHLAVGAIGVTHAPGALHGPSSAGELNAARTGSTPRGGSAQGFVGGNLARGSAERVGPSSRSISGSVGLRSGPSIVGRPGSYSLRGASPGRNGYEVHRPPIGYASRTAQGTAIPRTYSYSGTTQAVLGPSGAERVSTPPAVVAPHASVSSGAASHSSGGTVSSGGGFHGGGGFSGGGSHGGGGGGHR
jgi:hypothetical protein